MDITRECFAKVTVFPVQPFTIYDPTLGPAITSKSEAAKLTKTKKEEEKPLPLSKGQLTITAAFNKGVQSISFEELDNQTNDAANHNTMSKQASKPIPKQQPKAPISQQVPQTKAPSAQSKVTTQQPPKAAPKQQATKLPSQPSKAVAQAPTKPIVPPPKTITKTIVQTRTMDIEEDSEPATPPQTMKGRKIQGKDPNTGYYQYVSDSDVQSEGGDDFDLTKSSDNIDGTESMDEVPTTIAEDPLTEGEEDVDFSLETPQKQVPVKQKQQIPARQELVPPKKQETPAPKRVETPAPLKKSEPPKKQIPTAPKKIVHESDDDLILDSVVEPKKQAPISTKKMLNESDDDLVFDYAPEETTPKRLKKAAEIEPSKPKKITQNEPQKEVKTTETQEEQMDEVEEIQDTPMINKNTLREKRKAPGFEPEHSKVNGKSKAQQSQPEEGGTGGSPEEEGNDSTSDAGPLFDMELTSLIADSQKHAKKLSGKKTYDTEPSPQKQRQSAPEETKPKRQRHNDEVQNIAQNGMKTQKPDVISAPKKASAKASQKSKGLKPKAPKAEISSNTIQNLTKMCADHAAAVGNKTKKPLMIMDLIDDSLSKEENEEKLREFIYNTLLWTYYYVPQNSKHIFSTSPFPVEGNPAEPSSFRLQSYIDFAKCYYAAVASRSDTQLPHHSKKGSGSTLSLD